MSKVAIVYWSGTGNTEAMATAIAAGVKTKGGEADLLSTAEFSAAKVSEYTAFAFGCPSMGSEVLAECDFQPMWDDVKSALSGKTVLLFGSYGWGDGEWMRNWQSDCDDANINVTEAITCNEAPDATMETVLSEAGEALVG